MNSFSWALLTALTWGCVPVIEKLGLLKISPVIGLFYRCLGVVLGITLLTLLKGKEIRASFHDVHPAMLFLVLGGLLASVLGQLFFYNALKTGEASQVVPLAAAYPIITFILGVAFLGEKFTLAKLGGLVLIMVGTFFLK